jgi:lysophospholipase L1-like esterase
MSAHFESEAPAIYLRVELDGGIAMAAPHMSATCKSGLDLYARLETGWRWVATYQPRTVRYAGPLVTGLRDGRRKYQLNLPIYNGVKSLAVGVMAGAHIEPIPPRKEKPILFYGTSVTQGACASRPGMAFVSIIGRRMDRPVLNFGFSGNGVYEMEVGRFLNEIDPAVFVLDCVGNSTVEQVERRVEPLVRLWREKHPETPILLLERAGFPDEGLVDQGAAAAEPKNEALRKAYERLTAAGVKGLHYRDSHDFLGDDGEGTVDGSHPNDLGMMRYADAVEGALRRILG